MMGEPEIDKKPGTLIATEVTEPLPVPAPIALRKVAASSALTELSALKRGKVTALGLVMVKRFPPRVEAPRPVRAVAALVPPVPPAVRGKVPVVSAEVDVA